MKDRAALLRELWLTLPAPLERTTLLEDGRPIEFVRSWYRGDRYHLIVRLGRT